MTEILKTYLQSWWIYRYTFTYMHFHLWAFRGDIPIVSISSEPSFLPPCQYIYILASMTIHIQACICVRMTLIDFNIRMEFIYISFHGVDSLQWHCYFRCHLNLRACFHFNPAAIFYALDKDKDGAVDQDEFISGIQKMPRTSALSKSLERWR